MPVPNYGSGYYGGGDNNINILLEYMNSRMPAAAGIRIERSSSNFMIMVNASDGTRYWRTVIDEFTLRSMSMETVKDLAEDFCRQIRMAGIGENTTQKFWTLDDSNVSMYDPDAWSTSSMKQEFERREQERKNQSMIAAVQQLVSAQMAAYIDKEMLASLTRIPADPPKPAKPKLPGRFDMETPADAKPVATPVPQLDL